MKAAWLGVVAVAWCNGLALATDVTRIIAHRGASAYLPEHSLEAYLLAYGQGADELEPDLVMTADGRFVSMHDDTLDATTDVARRFPGRARADGRFHVMDFTLDELSRLRLNERVDPASGKPRYRQRWPVGRGQFHLLAFTDLIELTIELNRMTGRRVGLYPELKFPAKHRAAGLDPVARLVEILHRYGLPSQQLPITVQCFEPGPLRRLNALNIDGLKLIQLLGENDWSINELDYEQMRSAAGLAEIASYADGIGPPWWRLAEAGEGGLKATELLGKARGLGLEIHPFTFRREDLPEGIELAAVLDQFIYEFRVEALFTDHPDVAVERIARRAGRP